MFYAYFKYRFTFLCIYNIYMCMKKIVLQWFYKDPAWQQQRGPGLFPGVPGGGGGCSEGDSGKCEALKEVPESSLGFHGMRGRSWSC